MQVGNGAVNVLNESIVVFKSTNRSCSKAHSITMGYYLNRPLTDQELAAIVKVPGTRVKRGRHWSTAYYGGDRVSVFVSNSNGSNVKV